MSSVIWALVWVVLIVSNLWGIIFVHIPLLVENRKIIHWIGLGISLSAIIMCNEQLGITLHLLGGNK